LQEFQKFDRHQPIWIESESYKIGEVYLPSSLWQKMKQSPCLEIQLSLTQRVEYLLEEYSHLIENSDLLKEKIQYLRSRYGWEKIRQWFNWIDKKQWQEFIEDLLRTHYDPAYQRSLNKTYSNITQRIDCSYQKHDDICNALTQLRY
ncbi:MAG: tRNA 2-selenouridine(34) synthase MnmH, partial [Cyanobacteria bacterium P01_G01_bin.49]